MTITEALQNIHTIHKRIEKKSEFIASHLMRPGNRVDPLKGESGGSRDAIAQEMQSISDLESEIITLRQKIAEANSSTSMTVCGETRTIEEWLFWKREVAPKRRQFLGELAQAINFNREQAYRRGGKVTEDEGSSSDLIINLDERALAKEREELEEMYSSLDGQLSLKNATTEIE